MEGPGEARRGKEGQEVQGAARRKREHNKCTLVVLTPIVALQTVSMGRVMKQVTVSATVRWNTR